MDPSEDDPGPAAPGSLVTGQQTKSVLVTIYKDNLETSKKIFHICDASQILENCYLEFPQPVQLERFLKYNKDFKECIDCDSTTTVQDYDKFQVHVATVISLQVIPIRPPQIENIQVSIVVTLIKSLIYTKSNILNF